LVVGGGGGGGVPSATDVLAPNKGTMIAMAAAPASAATRAVKTAARDLDMISSWDFFWRLVAPTKRIHAGKARDNEVPVSPL
jgi:hypothetical protein